MKCFLSIPYKVIAIALVGTAILLIGVMAVGVPAQIISLLN